MTPLLFSFLLTATAVWAQTNPLYSYQGLAYCPQGQKLHEGKCYASWNFYSQYQPRWPDAGRDRSPYDPQNIVAPSRTQETECPQGYKKARGECSKLTEKELELDSQPKEPCPPGQRRSRLICREYIDN